MKTLINKQKKYFLIEESIFKRLKLKVAENNETHTKGKLKVKLDVACFFIDLISYQEAKSKDKVELGFVPLMAKVLNKYHHNYKVYRIWLSF